MTMTVKKCTAALLATGLFAFSGSATATNGYFTHGVGTESKAMGGTGVGSSENMGAISAATNPALTVFSDEKWQIGLSVFSPMRSYTTSSSLANGQGGAFTLSAGKYDSENEAFPIPYVAKNWKLNENNALTFVFYGRGGMNTEWDDGQSAMFDPAPGNPLSPGVIEMPGVYGGGKAGVDLMQAFMSINFASKVGDNLSWGIGPVLAIQMFEATGLANFAGYTQSFADVFPVYFGGCLLGGGDPATCQLQASAQAAGEVTSLTNNGHDTSIGYGASAGMWTGNDTVSFGLAYQTKMSMDEFSDYSNLYAQAGGFDIPSTLKAGVSFKAADDLVFNIDYERIGYSDVDSVSNPMSNLFAGCWTTDPAGPAGQVFPDSSGCLGGQKGVGFGWQDMTVYKFGLAWNSDDKNTWRFGYSVGDQPIAPSEVLFNILAPGVMEQHFTFGWTSERANGNVMSVSLMYAPETTVSGTSPFDPTQIIELKMKQLELEFAYRF